MPLSILSIDQVNTIASEHFIKIFGNVVEHYPVAAICTLRNRPFEDANKICEAFDNFLEKLSSEEKERVLKLYPDLVGKLVDLSDFMIEIEQYQRISGADQLTIEDKRNLSQLNNIYREKFGFPFIMFGKAQQTDVFAISAQMTLRIRNSKEIETQKAIEEVKKISKIRIFEILQK